MSGTSGTYEIMAPVTTTPFDDRAPPDLSPGRRRGALGHPRRGCEGQGAAGGGGARHRLRRGRAGLPDAGAHRRGGRHRLPRHGQPPLHPDGRDPGAARGHRGQDPARLGLRGGRQPGARHQRRQAGRRQRVRGAVRPRRRGPGAGPVLDHLPRVDRPGRRHARHRVLRRDDRLPLLGRGPRARPGRRVPRRCSSSRRPTRPAPSTRATKSRPSASGRCPRGSGC